MNHAVKKPQSTKPFCVDKGVNELGYHCVELGFTTYLVRDGVISTRNKITGLIQPVAPEVLKAKDWIERNINQVITPMPTDAPKAKQKFCEFISQEDNGDYVIRLGPTIYFYNMGLIYTQDKDGQRTKLSLEEDVAKPWIRESLDREIAFQRRKKIAETFRDYGYTADEKRAYKRSQRSGLSYR